MTPASPGTTPGPARSEAAETETPPRRAGLVTRIQAQADFVAGGALMGLGLLAVVVASVEVSRSRYVSAQLSSMISGGLGGLLLLGTGAALVVSAGLADEWRKLDRIEAALSGLEPDGPAAVTLLRRGRVIAGVGMTLGAIVVLIAWVKASGDADPEPGLEALASGSLGVVIGAAAAGVAVLGLKRRVAVRRAVVFAPWLADEPARAPAPDDGSVVVAEGLTRFHRAGCPALAALATRAIPASQVPAGLTPCELCGASQRGRQPPGFQPGAQTKDSVAS